LCGDHGRANEPRSAGNHASGCQCGETSTCHGKPLCQVQNAVHTVTQSKPCAIRG
jgi:hypothetical protein